MSDLVFSAAARRMQKTIICANHPGNWILQQPVQDSIMHSSILGSQENHLKLVREIIG